MKIPSRLVYLHNHGSRKHGLIPLCQDCHLPADCPRENGTPKHYCMRYKEIPPEGSCGIDCVRCGKEVNYDTDIGY